MDNALPEGLGEGFQGDGGLTPIPGGAAEGLAEFAKRGASAQGILGASEPAAIFEDGQLVGGPPIYGGFLNLARVQQIFSVKADVVPKHRQLAVAFQALARAIASGLTEPQRTITLEFLTEALLTVFPPPMPEEETEETDLS